jgi:selenocysteine lyase/cysteine desulfurase
MSAHYRRLARMRRREWLAAGAGALLATAKGSAAPSKADETSRLPGKADFPLAARRTYLNNAGYHPMSVQASRAVADYLERRTEGTKEPAWDVSASVKREFAALINARPASVSYVTSTMVGENLVVAGLGIGKAGGNIVTDALHFEGSLYLYGSLRERGVDVRVVRPRDWRIDPRDLERAVDRNTKLVAVSLVSYLNGFRHDLKAVTDLAHAHGAYVYADIIQAAGALPVDVEATGVDFCACATYKWLMGDFGLGFFYVREDLLDRVLPRVQYGWRQFEEFEYHMLPGDSPGEFPATWRTLGGAPGHFEMGTFSRTAEACLAHSLRLIREVGVERIQARVQSLTARLQKELPALGFAPLTPPESRTPIVTFVVNDPEAVAAKLARAGVEVKLEQHYMRVSPSVYNDQADVDQLLNALS